MQACKYNYKSKRMAVSGACILMIIGRTLQTWNVDNFIIHFTFLILLIQSDMKGVGAQTYFKHYNSSQMKDINLKISAQKYMLATKQIQ